MTTTDTYLATGFRDVDVGSDTGKMVACLRFLEGLPSFRAYKARALEAMRVGPGDRVADLGCGLGFDTARLAEITGPTGKIFGVDSSRILLNAAERASAGLQGVEFRHADIHDLPFESGSLDAVRVDRTLQHVEDPQKVIAEMARVLKPGGRLVAAEPDWFTFVIDSEDPDWTGRVVKRWRGSFRNPAIGRQLLRRIRQEGLADTWMEGFILLADGLDVADRVYDLSATVGLLEAEHPGQGARSWLDRVQESDRHIPVSASVTLFLAGGEKPLT